jgi:hypothetical protein
MLVAQQYVGEDREYLLPYKNSLYHPKQLHTTVMAELVQG